MLIDGEKDNVETIHVTKEERLVTTSASKGNQIKWLHDSNYIKLDQLGYEGLAEAMVSWLLRFTDIPKDSYVEYKSCKVKEDGRKLGVGCYSKSFLKNYSEVTVRSLLEVKGKSSAISYDELRDFLFDIVGYDVKRYLDRILCLDAITRNDDRHFGNILFLFDGNKYLEAPIFDNGGSCMSDLISYPINVDFKLNYKSILAKPFRVKFEQQLYNPIPIRIRYDDFINSIDVTGIYATRAFNTIKQGLADTEGLAWERF